jgi:DnaJ-class molecular chaperone
MAKTLYDILGVTSDVDATIIRRRYRDLARQLHPDLTGGDKVKEHRFKEVATAYAILGDEARRAAYDREVAKGGSSKIFGLNFEDLVARIRTEGLRSDNMEELLDDFLDMAKRFHEEAPKKVKHTVVEDPGSLLGLIEDLFGLSIEVKPKKKG